MVLALAVLAPLGIAVADSIGPLPSPVECPPGGRSYLHGVGHHDMHAYCGPYLAPSDAPCRPGWRRDIMELAISPLVGVGGGARMPTHGGLVVPSVPHEPSPVEVALAGPCDADDAETAIAAPEFYGDGPMGRGGPIGPSSSHVPTGCHRVWVWIEDPSVHCAVAPAASPLPPEIEAGGVAPSVPAPSEPAAGCGCSRSARGSTGRPVVVGVGLALLAAWRRFGRR